MSNLTVDIGIIITCLLAMLGTMAALVRVLFAQFEKRLDERWLIVEQARINAMRQWEQTFQEHIRREETEFATMRNFEQQFMAFATSLPTLYLRRDEMKDYLVRLDMKFESINEKLNLHYPHGKDLHDSAPL